MKHLKQQFFNNICYGLNSKSLTISEGQFPYIKAKTGEIEPWKWVTFYYLTYLMFIACTCTM